MENIAPLILEHYKRYLTSSGVCKRPRALRDYLLTLDMYGREVDGDILKFTTEYRILHFTIESLAAKTLWPDGRKKKKWGMRMIYKVASELSVFFRWAYQFQFTPHDVMKDGHLFNRGGRSKPEFFEWESEDFKVLIHHPANQNRDLALFHVLRSSGIRVSEASNLNIEHALLDKSVLKIDCGKGGEAGFAPLDDDAIKFLDYYIKGLKRMGFDDKNCLFPARMGRDGKLSKNRYKAHSIHKMISLRGRDMGIHAYPHKLRHSLAAELLGRGGDLLLVAEALRHKDLNTTRHYTHLGPKRMSELYKKTLAPKAIAS